MILANENKRLISRAKELCSGLSDEQVVSVWEYNLNRAESDGMTDGFVLVTEQSLLVYENGETILEASLSSIEEFKFTAGVGCVFAEYTDKSGKPS